MIWGFLSHGGSPFPIIQLKMNDHDLVIESHDFGIEKYPIYILGIIGV
jgi:hypothetical protein